MFMILCELINLNLLSKGSISVLMGIKIKILIIKIKELQQKISVMILLIKLIIKGRRNLVILVQMIRNKWAIERKIEINNQLIMKIYCPKK